MFVSNGGLRARPCASRKAANVTNYDRTSGRLAFSVHIEYGDFHFIGKIEPDRLEGTISSPWETSSEHLQLKVRSRKIAYEPTAECAPL